MASVCNASRSFGTVSANLHRRTSAKRTKKRHSRINSNYAEFSGIRKSLSCHHFRGALLHDYFLYDWHLTHERWHGFRHPYIALSNASRDFDLTAREKNIIVRHMFPLTPIPPKYRESLLVSTADKICALKEVFVGISNYFRCHQRLTQALLRACTILITILTWTH